MKCNIRIIALAIIIVTAVLTGRIVTKKNGNINASKETGDFITASLDSLKNINSFQAGSE